VEACPFGAVLWDDEQNKPEICIHCSYCVLYCPYDVLGMEEVGVPLTAWDAYPQTARDSAQEVSHAG
jgi:Fe-S-cluster-containing hydrogenase component 2